MARDGRDGVDGRDGKDADPVVIKRELAKLVEAAMRGLPPPKAGRDGSDGINGKDAACRVFRVEVIREDFNIPGVGTLPLAIELVIRPE
ncbi:MAG: hypothetical protein ABI624_10645 [Casimicrobiaceae bacterium]